MITTLAREGLPYLLIPSPPENLSAHPSEVSPLKVEMAKLNYGADGGIILNRFSDLREVRRAIYPNAFVLYDANGDRSLMETDYASHVFFIRKAEGRVPLCTITENESEVPFRVEDFNFETTKDIKACLCAAKYPWLLPGFMWAYTGNDHQPVSSLGDLPRPLADSLMKDKAAILTRMVDQFGLAVDGANNSVGVLEGPGLMSMTWAHGQFGTFNDWHILYKLLTEDLPSRREAYANMDKCRHDDKKQGEQFVWDGGLSTLVGEWAGEKIGKTILPNYFDDFSPSADDLPVYWEKEKAITSVRADSLGFTFTIPGFRPSHMAERRFMEKLWQPISLTIHHELCYLHSLLFNRELEDGRLAESDLDEVIKFSLKTHQENKGNIKEEEILKEYRKFFRRKPEREIPDREETRLLKRLADNGYLRPGFGWAEMTEFTRTGASFAFIFGFGNWAMGPMEALGSDFKRINKPIARNEQKEVSYYCQQEVGHLG